MIFGKYINKYYKKYWYLFIAIILTCAFVDIIQLYVPKIIGCMISALNLDANSFLQNDTSLKLETLNLPWYANSFSASLISIAVIAFLLFLGRALWRIFASRLAANIERDIRLEMFRHIQTLSMEFYHNQKVGGLLAYFTNDLTTIKTLYREGLIFLTDLFVLGILSFTYMCLLSPFLALCTGLPLLSYTIFGKIVGNKEKIKYQKASDSFESLSDYTEESLQGFSVIKAFRRERLQSLNFQNYSNDTMKTNVAYQAYSSWIDALIDIMIAVVYTLIFALGSYALINTNSIFAGNIKNIGDLTTYIGYNDSLIWPMIAGGILINEISTSKGAYGRIESIFETKNDVIEKDNLLPHNKIVGDIEFKNLSFKYDKDYPEALKNISFHIKPKMMVGIIGRTGSGKSTIPNLLLKLHNVPENMIYIDGEDINDWKKEDLRKHIALVNQESFLFSGTIIDAVSFTEESNIDIDKVKRCCQFASIDEDIEEFELGYKTQVGEKGSQLSGGQRQRISIARAIYSSPDVLILDDSLSAVDAETEKNILASIKHSENRITTLVVTHRISSICDADLIIVLDKGKLIGLGKHEDLLKNCDFYKNLSVLQDLEKEVN